VPHDPIEDTPPHRITNGRARPVGERRARRRLAGVDPLPELIAGVGRHVDVGFADA
jgi:hypothetical protein